MAFEYVPNYSPMQGLDYSGLTKMNEPQQQQQQQNPMAIMSMLNNMGIMPGGEGGGMFGAGAGGGGEGAVAGAGEGGSGFMSGIGSVASNPWAWLAAAIIGNEAYAHHRGYRDESGTEYAKDLATGEVFYQDMEQRFLPDLGFEEGSTANKWLSFMANPMGSGDPGRTWDRIKGLFGK